MDSRGYSRILVFLACALVAACAASAPDHAAGAAVVPVSAPLHSADAQPELAEVSLAITPAIVAVREQIQDVLPDPVADVVADAVAANPHDAGNPLASALIIRWEIGSPARYARLYERPVWPGGASGVTWGVGYDGGQVTPRDIANDWRTHPQVLALAGTAGVAGVAAKTLTAQLQQVRTPYPLAEQVFAASTLPAYRQRARRAYGPALEGNGLGVQAAVESLTYNRGPGMASDRNREKREIRDRCLPAHDAVCVAEQLRNMRRLWPSDRGPDPGLRNRRDDEARTALAFN